MKFAHLSDLHFLTDYHKDRLLGLMPSLSKSPVDAAREVLSAIAASNVDFVLLTGDNVHEGNAEDYRLLKSVLEETLGEIPYFLTLGNHDRIEGYVTAFGDALVTDGQLFYAREISGIRLIVLDTGYTNAENGELSEAQWTFFAEEMKKPGPSIVALHHPPHTASFFGMEKYEFIKDSARFEALLTGDVIGIFCGHTHSNKTEILKNALHSTAGSLAFGGEFSKETISFNDDRYYSLGTIDAGSVSVGHFRHGTETTTFFSMKMTDLMKAMNEKERV